MTSEFDKFSVELLEEAKRFLEKASAGIAQPAFLHASLVLAFSSLESHINGIAEELMLRNDNTVLEQSLLSEREVKFDKGEWALGKARYFRMEDRMAFLIRKYSSTDVSGSEWWSEFKSGGDARNKLVHPRDAIVLTVADVERYLLAIIEALNAIYLAVFNRGHPSYGRGLQSTSTF